MTRCHGFSQLTPLRSHVLKFHDLLESGCLDVFDLFLSVVRVCVCVCFFFKRTKLIYVVAVLIEVSQVGEGRAGGAKALPDS